MKPKKPIETLILNIRNQKVILDADLGVAKQEDAANSSQFVTSSERHASRVLRSQIVTLNNFINHPTR
jgi:hypothetical protein